MANTKFVHLNVHTEYSLKDSLVRISDLIASTKKMGMGAVAISDTSNLFASVKHFKKSIANGVKPIIAAEVTIASGQSTGKMTLIAQNSTGHRNLIELISRGYEEGFVSDDLPPLIQTSWLEEHSEGLIGLSGARRGLIGQELIVDRDAIAEEHMQHMSNIFPGRFYIELQRTGHPMDDKHVLKATRKAAKLGIPVVATNPVLFINPNDYVTHEVRSAIAQGMSVAALRETNPEGHTPEQFLKSPEEMISLFEDIPSAIENTVNIARRCSVDMTLGENFLPAFPVPEGMNEATYLEHAAQKGLEDRLSILLDENSPDYGEKRSVYEDRLKYELKIINDMGFPGYFLIVSDFIQWSKDNGIPVGPGRGSGAGSLVAYSLKITDLDPLEYDLLFERFLNPERVSMPDFDVDFCMDRREEVIKYVSKKYGENAVSQIVTFGTMAAKMVVRDVARALGYPYAVGNRISNMIPGKPGTKLQDAINENTELKLASETDSEVKAVIEHSLKLEGLTRQTGKHAGGVLIAPGKLTDFTATLNEVENGAVINKVSQLDKDDVEAAGLVKFDFLGLKTLTIIQNAVNNANARIKKDRGESIDITRIPLDDTAVYKLLQDGLTTAVFQVESKGMKDLLKRIKPDTFEDLIALVALYRPGPLESGMVDNFINRKHGREEISYPDSTYQHESLKEILEPTYGIILYQEQVMQIAQTLAGYTLGEADMLRRAMGKKKPEEMAKQRSIFKDGAIKNGVDGDLAMKIFDLVEKFAGYGFNKSHSAAYALIAYQTAWLKTHYPSEFMAAVLSGDMDNTDKIVTYVNECRNMGLKILPPDINKSVREFKPENNTDIIYGLGAVKRIGESAIRSMLEERTKNGEFKNLYDFCTRCKPKKPMIEAGIRAGALDQMGPGRAALMNSYPQALNVGKQVAKKELDSPQLGMFGSILDDESLVRFENVPDWDDLHRLSGERETLGLYLTGHPIETYENELSSIVSGKISDLVGSNMEEGNDSLERTEETRSVKWEDKSVTVAGLIMEMDVRLSQKGQQTCFLTIDDKSRQLDVMVFNKTYNDCQHVLSPDSPVVIEGRLRMDKKSKRIRLFASNVRSIDTVRERNAESIKLDLNPRNFNDSVQKKLKELIEKQPDGYASINAHYVSEKRDKKMRLGDYEVKISDEFLNGLSALLGKDSVHVVYRSSQPKFGKEAKKALQDEKIIKLEEGQRTRETRHAKMAAELDNARSAMGM